MKANELRVNNWYTSTKWQRPVRCELSDIAEIHDRLEGAEEKYAASVVGEIFQPLPLTEEWLLKFGFNNTELGAAHNIFKWFGNHIGISGMLGTVKPVECKYVHQLQNLYFALTGEELTIKE